MEGTEILGKNGRNGERCDVLLAGIFPLTRRNFRFPGNEARSAEVTASLIEPGSSGIVSARRRRTSRIPRAHRSVSPALLLTVLISSGRLKTYARQ